MQLPSVRPVLESRHILYGLPPGTRFRNASPVVLVIRVPLQPKRPPMSILTSKDVFICHASEVKESIVNLIKDACRGNHDLDPMFGAN